MMFCQDAEAIRHTFNEKRVLSIIGIEEVKEAYLNLYESLLFYLYCKHYSLEPDEFYVTLFEDFFVKDPDSLNPDNFENYEELFKFTGG